MLPSADYKNLGQKNAFALELRNLFQALSNIDAVWRSLMEVNSVSGGR